MNDACYASSVDKIFGTVGPYVVQYNATTGIRESYLKIGAPLYGEMRICYHAATDKLYVGTWHLPNQQYYGLTYGYRDIFEVDTSLVAATSIGMDTIFAVDFPYIGFRWLASVGSYLHCWYGSFSNTMRRFDPTNLADRNSQAPSFPIFMIEHGGFSGTQIAVPLNYLGGAIRYAIVNYDLNSDWNSCSINPYIPVACEYATASSKFYAVCGDDNLIRIDDLATSAHTQLNLGPVEATADPCRIRYWSGTSKLYLPCMTGNGIIVWDPAFDTPASAEFKSGFDNPVDVVFTTNKAFAVQNATVGLMEIT